MFFVKISIDIDVSCRQISYNMNNNYFPIAGKSCFVDMVSYKSLNHLFCLDRVGTLSQPTLVFSFQFWVINLHSTLLITFTKWIFIQWLFPLSLVWLQAVFNIFNMSCEFELNALRHSLDIAEMSYEAYTMTWFCLPPISKFSQSFTLLFIAFWSC